MPVKKTRKKSPTPPSPKNETSITPTTSRGPDELLPYTPFADMDRMTRILNRRFADVFGVEPFTGLPGWELPSISNFPSFRPAYSDVEDTGKAFVIRSELPGVKKEDVKVTVHQAHVEISAQTSSTTTSGEKTPSIYRERSQASFYRAFNLPTDVDARHAEASFQDGVLTLTLPKVTPTEPETTSIPVQ